MYRTHFFFILKRKVLKVVVYFYFKRVFCQNHNIYPAQNNHSSCFLDQQKDSNSDSSPQNFKKELLMWEIIPFKNNQRIFFFSCSHLLFSIFHTVFKAECSLFPNISSSFQHLCLCTFPLPFWEKITKEGDKTYSRTHYAD